MKLFLDSNIPMYASGAAHPNREPSIRLLGEVRSGKADACTSTEVLQEILHRYSCLGRLKAAGEVMPTRNFRELLDAMPPERQRAVAERVRKTIAAMPLDAAARAADDAGKACREPLRESGGSVGD